MSAGTGIRHSEFNPSPDTPLHLMQIWLLPNQRNLKPDYAQKPFPATDRQDKLLLVASKDGRHGSITIHSDAELYVSRLATAKHVEHKLGSKKHAWVQVLSGELDIHGAHLNAGDGAAISDEDTLRIEALKDAEFLLFDLA
jgi:redox-sensitive bicupin YhaK (pirin superfamily)